MKAILQRYVGKEVGINLYKPFNIDTFTIDVVEDNYITVSNQENSNLIHIPFQNVLQIREDELEGIHVGGLFHQKKSYGLVVKIGHHVTSVPE